MIALTQATREDVHQFGHRLFYDYHAQVKTFEEASSACVRMIYDTFGQDNGEPCFALARIYRLCKAEELAPDKSLHWEIISMHIKLGWR